MTERTHPDGPEEPERAEAAEDGAAEPERAEAAEDGAAEAVDDLAVTDEEISERIRGGRRATSIPY